MTIETNDEKTFATEVNCASTSIGNAMGIMQLGLATRRPVLLVGDSSTAKTAAVRALAAYNEADVLIYSLACREAQDIVGPLFPRRDGTFVNLRDSRIPVVYRPTEQDIMIATEYAYRRYSKTLEEVRGDTPWSEFLSAAISWYEMSATASRESEEFAETLRAKMRECMNAMFRAQRGEAFALKPMILFFDEVNRGDGPVLNAVMPAWSEHMLGVNELGPNVRVIAAMNPPGGAYAVTSAFSTDPAMRRRLITVHIEFNSAGFMAYRANPARVSMSVPFDPISWVDKMPAQKSHLRDAWNDDVNAFLNAHPKAQYDRESYTAGMIYGCPATWEAVSDILDAFEAHGGDNAAPSHRRALHNTIAGCVGKDAAEDLLYFIRTRENHIDPLTLLTDFNPNNTETYAAVLRMVEEGSHATLTDLLQSATTLVMSDPPEGEARAAFVDSLGNLCRVLPQHMTRTLVRDITSSDSPGTSSPAAFVTRGLQYGMTPDGEPRSARDAEAAPHPGWEVYLQTNTEVRDEQRKLMAEARSAQR